MVCYLFKWSWIGSNHMIMDTTHLLEINMAQVEGFEPPSIQLRCYELEARSDIPAYKWYPHQDSNLGSSACKTDALYQLSYASIYSTIPLYFTLYHI